MGVGQFNHHGSSIRNYHERNRGPHCGWDSVPEVGPACGFQPDVRACRKVNPSAHDDR